MNSLIDNYLIKNPVSGGGIIEHGVYAKPIDRGIDECNIWGCYYYMEALLRMYKGSKAYW